MKSDSGLKWDMLYIPVMTALFWPLTFFIFFSFWFIFRHTILELSIVWDNLGMMQEDLDKSPCGLYESYLTSNHSTLLNSGNGDNQQSYDRGRRKVFWKFATFNQQTFKRSFVRKWCIIFKFPLHHQNEKFHCEFYLPSLTFEQFELKLYLSFGSNYIDVKPISIAFAT